MLTNADLICFYHVYLQQHKQKIKRLKEIHFLQTRLKILKNVILSVLLKTLPFLIFLVFLEKNIKSFHKKAKSS